MKELEVFLLSSVKELDEIEGLEDSDCIFLWSFPDRIADIVELNARARSLANQYKNIYEVVIINLSAAGYPPMTDKRTIKELSRIANLYAESSNKEYKVNVNNFLEITYG